MNVSRTVFSFGSPCNGQYGHLVLRDDGAIYGYSHPNEHSWSRVDGELRLHSESGEVTSRFQPCGESNAWLGTVEGRKWPLFLLPIVKLDDIAEDSDGIRPPSFFVNSIPKSGTYFVEAALQGLGIVSQRLHLSGRDVVDDYRGLPESQIHVAPEQTRLSCEVELVTALLRGEQVVGHVEHQHVIDAIRSQGVCVLSVVRNLRNVLASLMRFKLSKVAATNAIDTFWRELDDPQRTAAFLMFHAERDLAHIHAIADTMHRDSNGIVLRYEEICNGTISAGVAERLDAVRPGMAEEFKASAQKQYGQTTPTYSGNTSDWEQIWTPDLEHFFAASGLAEANRALGYE